MPILLAWVIATIVLPVVGALQRSGMPRALAVLVVAAGLLAALLAVLLLLSTPFAYWLGRASELGALIKQKISLLGQPLHLLEEIRTTLNSITAQGSGALKVEQPSINVVTAIIGVLTPAISQFVLFVGALLFYLVYREKVRATAVMLLRNHDTRLMALRTLRDIDESMSTYFSTFTVVNFSLGVVTLALAYFAGLPSPLLWGVLAGVLNYIPYLGPAIVTATLAIVGLLTLSTLFQASLAPLIYIAIVTVEGQFLTPTLVGRRLELNPFAIFIAIAFCTWLWGPVGAFLAVPLLMALTVTLGYAFGTEKPDLPE